MLDKTCIRSHAHLYAATWADTYQYTCPSEFLLPALKGSNKNSIYTDGWGLCIYCHAIPSQCRQA